MDAVSPLPVKDLRFILRHAPACTPPVHTPLFVILLQLCLHTPCLAPPPISSRSATVLTHTPPPPSPADDPVQVRYTPPPLALTHALLCPAPVILQMTLCKYAARPHWAFGTNRMFLSSCPLIDTWGADYTKFEAQVWRFRWGTGRVLGGQGRG